MRDNEQDDDLANRLVLDASPGPAIAIDDKRATAIVAAALAGAGFGPPAGSGGAAGGAKGIAFGKLAIVAGVAGAIAVTAWIATRGGDEPAPSVSTTPPPVPLAAAPTPAPPASAPTATAPADDEIEMPPDTRTKRRTHRAPAPPKPPPPPPAATTSPEDLLAEANAARIAHRWADADKLYAQVIASSPGTLAGETALVASASLHLEHLGDAAGGAARFRRALAASPRGALAEEARWGLAEALRTLGDAGEAAALDDFLAHHATSPLAERARARRRELGGSR